VSADVGDLDLDPTATIARELIRIDTSNYGEGRAEGEREAADYVATHLRRIGLEPVVVESAPRRANVVARVRGTDPTLPALVVHGHLDVVPADPAQWSVDPFAGVVRDGMLWGRGAVDMKNMDAMIITALDELLADGPPRRDLIIAFFADEENGGVFGARHMVTNHAHLFAGATEAISEVGGYSTDIGGKRVYLLQTGEKSMIWVKLTAHAPAAHGSRVVDQNAVTMLAETVARIGRMQWPTRLTDTTEEMIVALAEILGCDRTRLGPNEIVLRTGTSATFMQAALRTTANPTLFTAGYKQNVIPERAEARLDIRTLPGDEQQVIDIVREAIGAGIDFEVLHRDPGMESPASGELYDAMRAVLARHDPDALTMPWLVPIGSDNKALAALGITGYGFTPLRLPADFDLPAMFHGVDERIPLSALTFGRGVLRDLLRSY
jgi:acetylornithine deacetylase/succinyl-diaminopimelate desuccinylase-like protein